MSYRRLGVAFLAFTLTGLLVPAWASAAKPAPSVPAGKPADMNKPVQVFILLGQSNMVGLGHIGPVTKKESLEYAVKTAKKYPYLVDAAGNWVAWRNIRFVRVMDGRGGRMALFNNEPMTVARCRTIGPEFGIAHEVGDYIASHSDAPVMILKSCIGNRSIGWDLLPPGSKGYDFTEKDRKTGKEVTYTYAGYKQSPMKWVKGTTPKPIGWYAGKQYDDDVANAKTVLADLKKYYPGATKYEVAGFFFWQGEKDCGDVGLSSHYEENLVNFIKSVRKDFNAPNAPFVMATLGEASKGISGNEGKVLEAQLAVDGTSGKYPEFKGNVGTVYSHPMAQGGSGNGHYGGKAEVYMDVGQAMGQEMVKLLGK